jgi:hypothetical protein
MKWTGTLRAPRIDFRKFSTAMADVLADAIAEAAFRYLEATAHTIPVWSGASRATFLSLASDINFTLNIALASGAPNRIPLGQQRSDGEVNVKDARKGIVNFTYVTDLPHLIWNEFNNANINPDPTKFPPPALLKQPGPYNFQVRGADAFNQVAAKVRLPNPFTTMKVKEIKVT